MAFSEPLLTLLSGHMGGLDLLILPLLICALIVTFGWSVLGTKFKLALCFSAGVFLFKDFFEQLIDKRLFPDLHNYIPLVLGSITAGLLETGAFLLANRIVIIGIFFGGAIFPFLFLTHSSFLDFSQSLVATTLMVLAAIIMFRGLAMPKITQTKRFRLLISSICGALGIVYLADLPGGLSNWQLSDFDGFRVIIHMMQNNRLPAVICLSISGIAVQSLLHLALRQIQLPKNDSCNRKPHCCNSLKL